MKIKRRNHLKEPVLEKEVSTPDGRYSCEIIRDETKVFSRYALDVHKPKGVLSCLVKNNGKLERFLGLNSRQVELTYLSFEGTDISHGDYNVQSEVENICYDERSNQFIISFYHLITFSDGLSRSLPKRLVQIPIPETIYRKIKKFF